MKFIVDSVDVSRFFVSDSLNLTKRLNFLGRINANQGNFNINMIMNPTLADFENKTIVIRDDDDNDVFTGVTKLPKLIRNNKQALIPIVDKWDALSKTKCQNKTWKNTQIQTIITSIITDAGETSYNVENPSIEVSWFSTNDKQTVREALEIIATSLGAYCYYDASGTLQFTAGFASPFSTSTEFTFNDSKVILGNVTQVQNLYDSVAVDFSEKTFTDTYEDVYIGAQSEDYFFVPADGYGVDEDFYVDLTKRIHELSPSFVYAGDTNLSFDSTTYDSNFQTSTQPKNDKRVKIRIDNVSASTKACVRLRIQGKPIEELTGVSYYLTGDNIITVSSEIVDDSEWAGKLAQWTYESYENREALRVEQALLNFALDIGDKVLFDTDRYIISDMTIGETSVDLTAIKDRGSAFVYNPSNVSVELSKESLEKELETIVDSIVVEGDGLPPPPFYWIDANCEATQNGRERIAHLEWESTLEVKDIDKFYIVYADDEALTEQEDSECSLSRSSGGSVVRFYDENSANWSVLEVSGSDRSVDIPIPNNSLWNFLLKVEDLDGYVQDNYLETTPDGILQLDFSGISIEPALPVAPTVIGIGSDTTTLNIQITTGSDVKGDWVLEIQAAEVGQSYAKTYTFEGLTSHAWKVSTNYYSEIEIPEGLQRQYKFRARYKNEDGYGPWSTERYYTIPTSVSTPAAPSGLSASYIDEVSFDKVAISWNATTYATSYEIEMLDASGFIRWSYEQKSGTAASAPAWHWTVTNSWTVKVRGKNSGGVGAWSITNVSGSPH